jgi:hypothetical protein
MVRPVAHAATIIGALAASCQATTTADHRTETVTAILEGHLGDPFASAGHRPRR